MASMRLLPLFSKALQPSRLVAAPLSVRVLSLSFSPCVPSARTPRRLQPPRLFSSTSIALEKDVSPSKIYTYPEIASLSTSPSPSRILIDVREPSELASTGTIPTSKNIPLKTSPDAFFLSADEFEDKFGFPRPGAKDEVVFFCKSGVRSKAAAQLAKNAGFGGTIGEYPGSWTDWSERGGEAEKVR